MIVRASRSSAAPKQRGLKVQILAGLGFVLVAALGAACGDDDGGGTSPSIRQFCVSMFSSSSLACCTAADRGAGPFVVRYTYASAADCANRLGLQEAGSEGRQSFDASAASSCLAHLNARECGGRVDAAFRRAEQEAGCGRILAGRAEEGQICNAQEDCKAGLVCPPVRDTGLSTCSKPGGSNQSCISTQASSIDHPACEAGLTCTFTAENPASACPSPPCREFKCIPLAEEGEACTGLDCVAGLVCKSGVCAKGGPGAAGAPCQVLEQCGTGLYCDVAVGTCAPQREAGVECKVGNNPLLECSGICTGSGEGLGVCASFCGSP